MQLLPPPPGKLTDALLHRNAEDLKSIARRWMGSEAGKARKGQALELIAQFFQSPEAVAALVDRLQPFVRAALGLLKERGGVAPAEELEGELAALGVPLPDKDLLRRHAGLYHVSQSGGILGEMAAEGLLGLEFADRWSGSNRVYLSPYHGRHLTAFTDPRLLEPVTPVSPKPLDLTPVPGEHAGRYRRPAEVALRFAGLVGALQSLEKIPIKTDSFPPKPFFTRLAKLTGLDRAAAEEPDLALVDATVFYFQVLEGAGLVSATEDLREGRLTPAGAELVTRPYPEQAALWTAGYRSAAGWSEDRKAASGTAFAEYVDNYRKMRAALLTALGALPEPGAWYEIGAFAEALYARLEGRVGLGFTPQFYAPWNATEAVVTAARARWEQERRKTWERLELPWLFQVFHGPLYHLGLVELAAESGAPGLNRFRLTALGRSVLSGRFSPATAPGHPTEPATEPAWIVQANFEVLAYLDRAAPTQIAFLSRVAERQPGSGAVAIWKLTRDSVYQALEAGVPLPDLLETLERNASQPVPDGVRRTLQDWAGRRERLRVYRNVSILEFADQPSRDAALAAGEVPGEPLGDRYVRVSGLQQQTRAARGAAGAIDYLQPPAPCLDITEDGEIRLDWRQTDFLVRGELAAWAEPDPNSQNCWRLSQASVARAAAAGWTGDTILAALQRRCRHPVPPLLAVGIRGWASLGKGRAPAALAQELVLQLASDETAEAFSTSPTMQGFFRGMLGPRTFLVRPDRQAELERKLEALGLKTAASLTSLAKDLK